MRAERVLRPSSERDATVGVVTAIHPAPRRRGAPGSGPPARREGAGGARRRARGWCCCHHRCRRGLLHCCSREACADTTRELRHCHERLRQRCLGPDGALSRLMYWSGPLVVCFGMAGMSYSTYRGFTDVLPLLAPHRSWAWWGWGGACAALYANCVWNYLAAALVDPGAHTSRAFAELVQQARRSGALSEAALAEPSLLAQPELEAEYGRGAWVLQPPQAWGYCPRTLGLKVRTF